MTPLAIIGGGASGAIAALHLRTLLPGLPPIVVIEPRARLGAGLAYGAGRPEHRINVPASKMSAISADPLDFARWLEQHDAEPALANGDRYPSRARFGQYVGDRLEPLLEAGAVQHVRDNVVRVTGNGPFRITTAQGLEISAQFVLIATSHPAPALPPGLTAGPHVINNPWNDAALDAIGLRERVAIIGTGLSMADMVATLAARGHTGPILAFSRRGLRARGHAANPAEPYGAYGAARSLDLLAQIRRNIAEIGAWHPVIDAVRKQGSAIWTRLEAAERRRVVRHLRPFWDVHRFRIAPQIEAVLDAAVAEGRLEILAARLDHVDDEGGLHLRARGGAARIWQADRIINTTGPDHRGLLQKSGFLRELAATGQIKADPAGLGLHTAQDYRAVGPEISGQPSLFITGPLARGTFGELMGLPEITLHAEASAASVALALTSELVLS